MCVLSNIVFHWDVAFYSKCQSVMYEDKEAALILPMLYIIMWRWLKHSVAAYRKPEQQSETSFRAENSYMIVRTTCHKGCETTRSLRTHSQLFTKQLRKLETAFVPDLCLSASLAFCQALVASIVLLKKSRLSSCFSFLVVLRAVLCIRFCLPQL